MSLELAETCLTITAMTLAPSLNTCCFNWSMVTRASSSSEELLLAQAP